MQFGDSWFLADGKSVLALQGFLLEYFLFLALANSKAKKALTSPLKTSQHLDSRKHYKEN